MGAGAGADAVEADGVLLGCLRFRPRPRRRGAGAVVVDDEAAAGTVGTAGDGLCRLLRADCRAGAGAGAMAAAAAGVALGCLRLRGRPRPRRGAGDAATGAPRVTGALEEAPPELGVGLTSGAVETSKGWRCGCDSQAVSFAICRHPVSAKAGTGAVAQVVRSPATYPPPPPLAWMGVRSGEGERVRARAGSRSRERPRSRAFTSSRRACTSCASARRLGSGALPEPATGPSVPKMRRLGRAPVR
jgi:hypothetical protein